MLICNIYMLYMLYVIIYVHCDISFSFLNLSDAGPIFFQGIIRNKLFATNCNQNHAFW